MGKSTKVDNSGANAAALMQAELSKEQLEWAKQIYAETADERAAATSTANQVSEAQLAGQELQNKISQAGYEDYNSTYRPLEQSLVAGAQNYDTPERRAAEAQAASADAEASIAAQRGATMRAMERSGVNPASGKVMAMAGAMDIGAAKVKAGAANQAVRNVEQQGYARRMDAANLGRNIASSQATNASIASQIGAGAVGSSGAALSAAGSGQGILNSGYSGAQAGLAGAASTYNQIAQNQMASSQSGNALWGGLGSAAGQMGSAAITAWSDRDMKEDVRDAPTKGALQAVRDTPVALWRYKDDSRGADGGQQHLGPMAQDLQKTAGDDVAPGGKQIDLVNANGLVMAAVQELDKKINRLQSMAEKHGAMSKKHATR
ncbi:tail fiber domain-containing protein [Pantoea sp. 18069]|uniref:tail fiber domain-containing protein n=1 Tax=Pantoea sp. 18069 TaxID=2681415 RepID=UPI00135B17E5|nr:tail fiber domain-containing protein [Pantoea sp. 18069]